MLKKIVVRGARQHNLKNIDLEIPRRKLTVITGLSGSGKSSLAFDTIYAEGQRRYIESLSAFARQFLEQMEKPDVDSVEGLSPAISIEQKTTSRSPRSTVGTVTEIYDYMRLLFASIGKPHCHLCGRPIARQSLDQIVDSILAYPQDTRVMILAPVVQGRKGEFKKLFEKYLKKGYVRVRVDGRIYDLDEEIPLPKTRAHTVEVVVDRVLIRSGNPPPAGDVGEGRHGSGRRAGDSSGPRPGGKALLGASGLHRLRSEHPGPGTALFFL